MEVKPQKEPILAFLKQVFYASVKTDRHQMADEQKRCLPNHVKVHWKAL
jgi:hypothetical protein